MSYDSIHKQAPIPDEPRPKKKAVKQRERSDHRHDYERIAIDAHSYVMSHGEERPVIHIGERCRICGRLGNVNLWHEEGDADGLRRFEVDGLDGLFARYLPDDKEVK